MAINRFFNPSRGQYVSQFVPDRLPTDLMMGVLATKQKAEDDKQAMIDIDKQFDVKHIADAKVDREFRDQVVAEHQAKLDELYGTDVTSAKGRTDLKKYKDYINSLRTNQDVKTVEARKAQYDKDMEEMDKIRKGDAKHFGRGEYLSEAELEWQEYKDNEGFRGQYDLSKFGKAYDYVPDLKGVVGNIKASGWKSADYKTWVDSGVKHIHSKDEIDKDKVLKVYYKNRDTWRRGPVGEAFRKKVSMGLGLSTSKYNKLRQEGEVELRNGQVITLDDFENAAESLLKEAYLGQAEAVLHQKTGYDFQANVYEGRLTKPIAPTELIPGSTNSEIQTKEPASKLKERYDNNQNDFKGALANIFNLSGKAGEEEKVLKRGAGNFYTPESISNAVKAAADAYAKARDENQPDHVLTEYADNFNKIKMLQKTISEDPYRQRNLDAIDKVDLSNVLQIKEINFVDVHGQISNLSKNISNLPDGKVKENAEYFINVLSGKTSATPARKYFEENPQDKQKYIETFNEVNKLNYAIKAGSKSAMESLDAEPPKVKEGTLIADTKSAKATKKAIEDNVSATITFENGNKANLNLFNTAKNINVATSTGANNYDPVTGEPYYVLTYQTGDEGDYLDVSTGEWIKDSGEANKSVSLRFSMASNQGIPSSKDLITDLHNSTFTEQEIATYEAHHVVGSYKTVNDLTVNSELSMILDKLNYDKNMAGTISSVLYPDPADISNTLRSPEIGVQVVETSTGNKYYQVLEKSKSGGSKVIETAYDENGVREIIGKFLLKLQESE